jgi:predicted TIM-barrel fold metal-dependent hydrolase
MWALRRDPAHGRAFALKYADRLLFGRDYYGGELLEFLKTLELPTDVRERIFFRNAQKLVPDVTPNPPPLRAL